MPKKKNTPAPAAPSAPAQTQPPALSPEELRRLHIVDNAKDSIQARIGELQGLIKGSLQKTDQLAALAAVGESIMSTALHTRARLRAAQGKTDASLATKAAYVATQTRKALKICDQFETELTAWHDYTEAIKPALEACTRTVKDLDLPGMKAAIGCSGEALFDDEGAPAEKAAAAAAPAPDPKPPKSEPEPAAAPAPREIQTLGMAESGPVIDVEPEQPVAHFIPDDAQPAACDSCITEALEELEEVGVEAGLKRKDWKSAWEAWTEALEKIWPTDDPIADGWLQKARRCYDLVDFALHHRKPISWAVPTEQELFDHQRKLAIAAGE